MKTSGEVSTIFVNDIRTIYARAYVKHFILYTSDAAAEEGALHLGRRSLTNKKKQERQKQSSERA